MTKVLNLMEAGIINPSQWQIERVKSEVATILKIEIVDIEKIDYWVKQIWIKLVGAGAKFVSYRSLPIWFEEGLAAIQNCRDVVNFEKMGAIFRYEIEQYGKHYPPEILNQWQQAWAKKTPYFQTEEARLQLKLARYQEGNAWQQRCMTMLSNCHSINSLNDCYWRILEESEEFEDLPELVSQIKQLWAEKKADLEQPGDFWTPF
jgi:hypothetical protein